MSLHPAELISYRSKVTGSRVMLCNNPSWCPAFLAGDWQSPVEARAVARTAGWSVKADYSLCPRCADI